MDIVLRAVIIFCFLWLVTRAVGRSTLGELSTFELLLFVTMGDLIQQAVTQQDYSVTGAVLAIGTFALLTTIISWVQWRFPRTRAVIMGRPIVVMRDGACDQRAMSRQRLSVTDLMMAMRQEGIRRPDDIDLAVLEPNGRISFFTRRDGSESSGSPETTTET